MAENAKKDAEVDATEAPKKKAPAKKAPAKKAPAAKSEAAKSEAAKSEAAKAPAKKAPAAKASAATAPAEESVTTLKMHHLRPAPGAKKAKTRVGRGEASKGKTAGRGTKGTKARYQVPERFEGGQMPLHMRLPKLRGFTNPFRTEYQVVNLEKLSSLYPEGGSVTVEDLVAKGAVRKGQLVKVLGAGELNVKLEVAVDAYSGAAKDKILAAGGSVSEN
ncbi:50S ribosomal protein L15 [Cellulomonas sp. PhB143]|uniref:50S ribosomal protein L15 n=1 Tax=Cellulomonas sp. PhB143 TaxID=2485186 RepID=UPI000F4993C4|nr:50S ribosomal protein L15 [Cellulomonas sp. PhB143]ROS76797.1 LSU ribosomal protein L15P [Cellulomonas sp. PhB143]